MEFYILAVIIFIASITKRIPAYVSTVGIVLIMIASFITTIAPNLRDDMMTQFEPLLKYKNTCHLDYSIINSSDFFKNKNVKLDCSKIYMLDEDNSPLYKLSKKISFTNLSFLLQNNIPKGDISKIVESIPYENGVKDLDNDGFITIKEQEEYIRVNGDKNLLLTAELESVINCDRFNISLNYCDYNKFKKNFAEHSETIMKQLLNNKAIPFTVLN